MSLDEIGLLFGSVANSRHRLRLFEELKKYVERLRALRIGVALIVDGSFVMPCVEMPADIDMILVMPENWEKSIEEIPAEYYNLVSSTKVAEEFGLHLFVVTEHSLQYDSWIRFFSAIKKEQCWTFDIPNNVLKGQVRVTL